MRHPWTTSTLAISTLLLTATAGAQESPFELPIELTADGAIVDVGKDVGHVGPLLRDHDGDLDLVFGDQESTRSDNESTRRANVRLYLRKGEPAAKPVEASAKGSDWTCCQVDGAVHRFPGAQRPGWWVLNPRHSACAGATLSPPASRP